MAGATPACRLGPYRMAMNERSSVALAEGDVPFLEQHFTSWRKSLAVPGRMIAIRGMRWHQVMERREGTTFKDKCGCPDIGGAELTGNSLIKAQARLQRKLKLASDALKAIETLCSGGARLLQASVRHGQPP